MHVDAIILDGNGGSRVDSSPYLLYMPPISVSCLGGLSRVSDRSRRVMMMEIERLVGQPMDRGRHRLLLR